MANMDTLFKRPSAPPTKRKLDAPKDPSELYKSAKLSTNGDARSTLQASVQEEEGESAGPELPPDLDDGEEDEEGRFFGGGVSKDTRDVLDFVNEQDEDTKIEIIDSTWLRKTALSFEKKISKNAELRAKFEDDPQKFMASEADLDSSIKALSILSEHSELYREFAKLGCVASLVSLLSHENTDIAIGAIEIISELIDEDVEAEAEQWDVLVNALLDADLVDLLHANISRLNEAQETDRNGVYKILEILESLASNTTVADTLGKHASVIPWLLSRATAKETQVSQNKQYSAEVLSILLQTSSPCRSHFTRIDGVDLSLQSLAYYRNRDPEKDSSEAEYLENHFDSLTCIVDTNSGKEKFLQAEGVELCLIMLKEGKMSRPRALRLLDHAAAGNTGGGSEAICERIVEAAGLKPLFSAFMKTKSSSSSASSSDPQLTEHLLGILASMLATLPGESASRIRLLGKFIEKDYSKIQRVVELRKGYAARLTAVKNQDDVVVDDEEEQSLETVLSKRLDAGLFSLQAIDTILAWLIAEDDGAGKVIRGVVDVGAIRATLKEQMDGIEETDQEDGEMEREILATLISFLV